MKLPIDPLNAKKTRLLTWLEYRLLLLILVLSVLVIAISISEPVPQFENPDQAAARFSAIPRVQTLTPELTAAPAPTGTVTVLPTVTSIPAEWFTNRTMANGIILGAVALVLIIIGGTYSVIRRKSGY